MSTYYEHKCGDSLDLAVVLPDTFTDGYFTEYDVACQIRNVGPNGALIAEITCTWVDPVTTRTLQLALRLNQHCGFGMLHRSL